MRSERLMLLHGAMGMFRDIHSEQADLAYAGVTPEMWATLIGSARWRGRDIELCRRASEQTQ